MTVLTLAQSLLSIWHLNYTENDEKESFIEVIDVKDLVIQYFEKNKCLNYIYDFINENVGSCKIFDSVKCSNESFDNILKNCNKKGNLTLDDIIQSQYAAEEFDTCLHYVELCHRLGIALNIDTSDNETDPFYWDLSYDDNLNPLTAVNYSV